MAFNYQRGFTVKGSEDLIKFLGNFAPEIESKMLDASIRSAANLGIAKPIKTKIQQQFKRHTGNLLKGVKVGKVKGAPPGNIMVFMGPPAYHAHFFEFGTVEERPIKGKNIKGWTVKLGYNKNSLEIYRVRKFADNFRQITTTGGIKRKPFFIPGVEDNKAKAAEELKNQLQTRIAKYIVGKAHR
jgi:hypothetical protein